MDNRELADELENMLVLHDNDAPYRVQAFIRGNQRHILAALRAAPAEREKLIALMDTVRERGRKFTNDEILEISYFAAIPYGPAERDEGDMHPYCEVCKGPAMSVSGCKYALCPVKDTPAERQFETPGYALAMAVLQSSLYAKLDDEERADCDALIQRGMKAPAEREQISLPPPNGVFDESFGDPESLYNSRDWLEKALVAKGVKVTGKGCGFGQADIDIVLEGWPFNVSIRPLLTPAVGAGQGTAGSGGETGSKTDSQESPAPERCQPARAGAGASEAELLACYSAATESAYAAGYASGWADAREAAAKVCNDLAINGRPSKDGPQPAFAGDCAEAIRALSPPSAGGGK